METTSELRTRLGGSFSPLSVTFLLFVAAEQEPNIAPEPPGECVSVCESVCVCLDKTGQAAV